ncbi:MAG: hypothetical protein EXS39_05825 [Opitutaceae bacterium]|nr:hypothetical protein [Opitutaceae bacterium]
MRFRLFHFSLAPLAFVALASVSAQETRERTQPINPGTAAAGQRRPGARGPLPDPTLLDGSAQHAEKRPEYGMLGQFEIPGDENAKEGGKVGGPQDPNQKGGGSGQQDPNQKGGGGGQQDPKSSQGGQQAAGLPQGAAGGGAPQSGQQPPPGAQGGGAPGGPHDPNAKAEGVQVAELQGDPSASAQGQGAAGAPGDAQKPQQVAIGDPTMQIKPAANSPGAVGQVTAGSTQQMETKIGGGKGAGAPVTTKSPGGRGIEKGRVMPTGL